MPTGVVLLSLCQALLVSGNILLIAVSPLIGQALAPTPWLSTLPVATQWLGLMLATLPASLIMGRLGRKRGFVIGNLIGLGGTVAACVTLVAGNFVGFAMATTAIGIGIGFGQLYRFAAIEIAPAQARDRAVGLVMGGGVLAAFFGPWLARFSQDASVTPFLGSFIGLGALYLIALGLLLVIPLPPVDRQARNEPARPMAELLRQSKLWLAILGAMVGYGVMNLAMTATPLAMATHGHAFHHVSMTIQWHVLAMFVPSFFTGRLTQRLGAPSMIALGCVLLMASALTALGPSTIAGFNITLVLLGLGWNFTFLPATGLLTECYQPAEKARVQALNEFLVFTTAAITALAAGPLVGVLGWQTLNLWLLPMAALPLVVIALQSLVFAARRPQIRG
ncbi:MFS transporter [Halomonas denitrificans]|uniref:MFS transporter n=1 Tax=Halomonas TaxID=2745 RepID=UPI001C99C6F5|nr:MFS transporter [Halomonas denitrificans]MBY5970382.1 MFS transporter [Halomonas denitrificans]